MATELQWLSRFLVLFHFFLVQDITLPSRQRGVDATASATSELHPVVLLPGNTCSQLEACLTDAYEPPSPQCGLHKGDGLWFRLWKNSTGLQDPNNVPCFADQLRLVYDPVAGDYRDAPGVDTRVLSFGSTRGFLSDDSANKDLCMGSLVEALERAGYRDGETLFGAPYDFRYAPAAPGQPSSEFSRFQRRLRAIVQHASRKNGNKPVILVSHSQGGYFALEFLNRSPLTWRRRLVKHFVMASTGAGGFVLNMQILASNASSMPASVLSLRRVKRSFASAFTALPSPKVFGPDTPLVVTQAKNYTAHDMPGFLTAIGFPSDAARFYETRALPVTLNFRAPAVPVTCINGVGVPTVEKLVYWDGDFDVAPEVVYGDGDGLVNLASILALDTVIGEDPRQESYKSVKIANTSHAGVVSDGFALERVISEILDENQVIDVC